MQKPLGNTLVNFSMAFDSIHRGKMEQILLVYGLPKETLTAIMMLYKNMKVKVHSVDGDSLFWHCLRCTARGHISPVHNLPSLCTLNIDKFNERKWLYTRKGKKQMIPCANYYGHRLC